jgi:predicted acetyltransferase
MALQLRTIEPGEEGAFARSAVIPFLELGHSDAAHHWSGFLEPERTWVVVDGDRFVANCCVFSRRLTLPAAPGGDGSSVSMAGVSGVGVHPTHRRRGLLTQMMAAMLSDARNRQDPVAALLASESEIYGRFGFGLATTAAAVAVSTRRSRFRAPVQRLPLTLMESEEAGRIVPDLFARVVLPRAGQIDRDAATWSSILADHVDQRRGATARYWVVCDEGYASWRVKDSTVWLLDLYGTTDEVEAGLWRFILDLDLVEEVTAKLRPIDESLRWRLADPRQLRTTSVHDFLWVRVLDVPAALESRGYAVGDRIVIEVEPPKVETADRDPAVGRFVLDAGPDGSSCRRATTAEPADLRLGLEDLGALLLGGVRPSALGRAGRVSEGRPGAFAAADRLFATDRAPFTGTSF